MSDAREYVGIDEFRQAGKRRYAEREIPGFGWMRIHNLSDFEVAEWEMDGTADKKDEDPDKAIKVWRANLIARCLVNELGERRCNNTSDKYTIAEADGAVVAAAFEFCREWCGIARRNVDAIEALKVIQKNCEPIPA